MMPGTGPIDLLTTGCTKDAAFAAAFLISYAALLAAASVFALFVTLRI